MTSSGLEWDYYEFPPVETSSLEYATPGENSLLLPANPVNSHWSSNAISDWSMSNHTAPVSEIVQDPVAKIKATKEEKNKKNQRRKARKNPRRSEREKEVSNLLCTPAPFWASWRHVHLCHGGGSILKRDVFRLSGTQVSSMSLASASVCVEPELLHHVGERTKSISQERRRPQRFQILSVP